MHQPERRIAVCREDELDEREFRVIPVRYRGQAHSAILFRLQGRVQAYLDQCVHMPRRLNCERDTIFSEDGDFLRCSMHGIVYDPQSGASISTLCNGERLQRIRIALIEGTICLDDKRIAAA
jgi:nitrite reductase/ring-hydroxylating ferredoxin subunit